MSGLMALVGSGEYLPVMEDVDRELLLSAPPNGCVPRVCCMPTAAGQEGQASISRWSEMGVAHFERLGASVVALPVIDRNSADNPGYADILANTGLVYFSGGNPNYLYQTLLGSRAWAAIESAWRSGAVFVGCSAGAMILGKEIPDFRRVGMRRLPAFGLAPVRMILPHFDRWRAWQTVMMKSLQGNLFPGEVALGIDENTALVGRPGEPWIVKGSQTVTVVSHNRTTTHSPGEKIIL